MKNTLVYLLLLFVLRRFAKCDLRLDLLVAQLHKHMSYNDARSLASELLSITHGRCYSFVGDELVPTEHEMLSGVTLPIQET